MTARTDQNGPRGSLPPEGMGDTVTAIIVGGMLANWMHWVGAWALITLSGGS